MKGLGSKMQVSDPTNQSETSDDFVKAFISELTALKNQLEYRTMDCKEIIATQTKNL